MRTWSKSEGCATLVFTVVPLVLKKFSSNLKKCIEWWLSYILCVQDVALIKIDFAKDYDFLAKVII